jgi:acetylglutamate kinase
VHGGGKRINNKLKELNIESNFIKGLRVTDNNTIKIVEDVLIEFNKEIVNALKNKSCDARSITTKEYNIILVKPERGELGFVGIPTEININVLDEIIKANEIPVIAPMGLKDNKPFNINADTTAGAIAKELKSRRLLLMTDIEGVIDRNNKLVSEITPDVAKKMINEEVIKGGMIPKINTCIDAINNGVRGVVIIDGRKPHSILFELFSDKGSGTLIRE